MRSGLATTSLALAGILLVASSLAPGCSRSKSGKTVSVIGSTSVQPFAEMLAEQFNEHQNEIYVEVQGGGSTAGIQAIESGYAHIGMCSRGLKASEPYTPITIAYDGLAVVVHNINPIDNLPKQTIADIFAGRVRTWRDAGVPIDGPIRLITREEGSGTREAFTGMVMDDRMHREVKKLCAGFKSPATMPAAVKDQIAKLQRERDRITMYSITEPSNGSVKALVSGDPAAVGYMSLGQIGKELRAVAVDGVEPSIATVLKKDPKERYGLVRPFLFVVKGAPTPEAQKFIDYVLSKEAQELLEKKGLVRAALEGAAQQ